MSSSTEGSGPDDFGPVHLGPVHLSTNQSSPIYSSTVHSSPVRLSGIQFSFIRIGVRQTQAQLLGARPDLFGLGLLPRARQSPPDSAQRALDLLDDGPALALQPLLIPAASQVFQTAQRQPPQLRQPGQQLFSLDLGCRRQPGAQVQRCTEGEHRLAFRKMRHVIAFESRQFHAQVAERVRRVPEQFGQVLTVVCQAFEAQIGQQGGGLSGDRNGFFPPGQMDVPQNV